MGSTSILPLLKKEGLFTLFIYFFLPGCEVFRIVVPCPVELQRDVGVDADAEVVVEHVQRQFGVGLAEVFLGVALWKEKKKISHFQSLGKD